MNTYMANPDKIERKWYVVDAEGQTLGRLASEVAKVLRGKNKPVYTPHVDTGDYVIIVNADKVKVTNHKYFENLRFFKNPFISSPAMCSASALLPPFPQISSLPPFSKQAIKRSVAA